MLGIRIGLALVVVVLAIFLISTFANAATWYVSPTGDDFNNDGSEPSPWRTIQHAVDQASPGDTIKVMDDDIGDTDDYTENITVDQNLTIERHDSNDTAPWVKAADANHDVFHVTGDNVTIRGLDIYGATKDDKAGIYINQVSGCTIQDNRCGWDSNHNNYYGIHLSSSSNNNTVSGNTCDSNKGVGIYLSSSSDNNTVSDNVCSGNGLGIYLNSSSNNNTISGNTCDSNGYGIVLGIVNSSSNNNTVSGNTCSNNYYGIHLNSSSDNTVSNNVCSNNRYGIYLTSASNNTLSGNTCLNNDYGIYLYSSNNNTVSGNTCSSNNDYGIWLYYSSSNTIYLNNFSDNTTNVYSEHSTNIWYSPTKLGYLYGSSTQTYKSYMGNYYSDYTGSDGDGDGIGDSPYDLPDEESDDEYPLMQTTDNYALQTWWLANPIMYRGDMSRPGGTVTISGGADQIWSADQPTLMGIGFGDGDEAEGTTWTGQVTFVSAPASGDTLTIEIGYADDQSGANFIAEGPETTMSGDSSTEAFTFTTNAVSFIVPQDKYLAMNITNNSGSDYDVKVGGSWSYVAAPLGSQDYSLPVVLSSFTATASGNEVILHWRTESEINNLGFNVYRSNTKEGAYTRVNTSRIPGAGTDATPHDYKFTDEQVVFGKTYYYYIEDIDFTGKTKKSHIIEVTVSKQAKTMLLILPKFALLQNFPNPFNPETWIPHQLAKDATVTISIYNQKGQLIRTLYLGNRKAGIYMTKDKAAYWDGKNAIGETVSSGVYFYQLKADGFSATRKMAIVK